MRFKKFIILFIFIFIGVFSVLNLNNLNAEETIEEREYMDIVSGADGGAVIDLNNNLYTWGYNEEFGTGNGLKSIAENAPQKIDLPDDEIPYKVFGDTWVARWFVVSKSGKLFTWGNYFYNDLADDYSGYVREPKEIEIPNDEKVKEFYSSETDFDGSFAIITEDDNLYMWGKNNRGQIGTGDTIDVEIPTKIDLGTEKVKEFYYDYNLTSNFVITQTDKLYVWGSNDKGELGLSYIGDNDTSTDELTTPTLNNRSFDSDINNIAMNKELTFFISDLGTVYISGSMQTYNVLFKDQTLTEDIKTPEIFNPMDGLSIRKIKSPSYLGLIGFITTDNDLYVLGDVNIDGLLGRDSDNQVLSVRYLVNLDNENVIDFNHYFNGYTYSIETEDNTYLLGEFETDSYWGENPEEDNIYHYYPHKIALPNDEKVNKTDINSGFGFYYVLSNTNNLYVFGDNYYGQLGLGDNISRSELTLNPYFENGYYTGTEELSENDSFWGGVVINNPSTGTLTVFGIAWYWLVLIGGAGYYFFFTKKGKKTIGL